jgi:N-methylhydantoinase B
MSTYNPIRLEVFKHLLAAAAEEMGVALRKASYSPNIKERRDFSCALFNSEGRMVAQAAHIPVHLGSMPLSVLSAVKAFSAPDRRLGPGDVVVLNDPFRGGTHLPDITLVSPIFLENDPESDHSGPTLIGYAASRAHHADVGGASAGSMSVASEIYQEGLIIPPVLLVETGHLNRDVWNLLLANVRTPDERAGDLWAQIAANRRGQERLVELARRYGLSELQFYMNALIEYTTLMTRRLIAGLPDGIYHFTDYLDDDGISEKPVPITAAVAIKGDRAVIDFTGSAPQQRGSLNAVYAITLSCVHYVFRCLIGQDVPDNAGCLSPLEVIAPEGSIVNAIHPSAVAGGNVETSQRIVDVLFGALAQASPERVPAASQGTMNNLTIGGRQGRGGSFTYYETIGGGMGARPDSNGPSAIHSHMTNTLNTPVEALEYAYPLRVLCYEIRRGSGGEGRFRGGDGIRRDIQALVECQASLLTERRTQAPYGLAGGKPGKRGENILIRAEQEATLPGKGKIDLSPGDILSIRTPGGGGHGRR